MTDFNSQFGRSSREGVSPGLAFVVVAAAAFAVLGVALVERETAYETTSTVRVSSTPGAEAVAKLSPGEVRSAVADLLTPAADEVLTANDAGATSVGRHSPTIVLSLRSANSQQLVERLNAAAGEFTENQNAAAVQSAESELSRRRNATAERRNERDALARKLTEREVEAAAAQRNAAVRELHDEPTPPPVAPGRVAAPKLQAPARALNPAWSQLRDEVAALDRNLAELRGRFTDEHPEVQHAAAVLADRTTAFEAVPQYVGGVGKADEVAEAPATPVPVPDEVPLNPPLVAPRSDAVADNAAAAENDSVKRVAIRAEVELIRGQLAAADAALDDAWQAENAASRRHIELAANGPWKFDPAVSVRTAASGASRAPWLMIAGISIAAGLVAAYLARGLRPVIGTAEEAATVLGMKVIGVIRTETPLPPQPADPGIVSARWLVRSGTITLAAAAIVAAIAVTAGGLGMGDISQDPTVLLSASRDWLASRISS